MAYVVGGECTDIVYHKWAFHKRTIFQIDGENA